MSELDFHRSNSHSILILSFAEDLYYTYSFLYREVLFLFLGFVPHQMTLLLMSANKRSTASAFGCDVLSSMTQTAVMWCRQWAAVITSVSLSVITCLNSCGAGGGRNGHNNSACVQGQQFSNNIPQILHATGGTFASKGLRRNWVGGDWYFLNRTGKAKQSLAASPHQLVASSPGHMPNPPAYTHWTDIVSWL